MQLLHITAAFAALSSAVQGLNILITSDDGFGAANVRELYKQMVSLGHNCYVVASVAALSPVGVHTAFTTSSKLLTDGDWGLIKAGAPSLGVDPNDTHIWYYNGTSTAQVVIALDYILPTYAKFPTPDLVISGPNSVSDSGALLHTVSGTMGATYVAIERGIPAMAFWTGNNVPIPYPWVNASTKVGLQDPATITARLASTLTQAFIAKADGNRVLPPGYGVLVSLPYITSYTSDACTNPPFVLARESSHETRGSYDTKSGLFTRLHGTAENGEVDPSWVDDAVNPSCVSSVTIFSVDYDAAWRRECFNISDVTAIIPLIVHINGSTPLTGGLGPNASVSSNSSHPSATIIITTPPSSQTTLARSIAAGAHWSFGVAMFCLVMAVLTV
ncbi:putative acid phosphatase [Podospora australis]|uniref:Acid phosphatase n=1 Tax=Podospora australis TaxID=1536484 RepID=A0AAN6WSM4_9PEZI|nr:putative acid phosphatase [Podospora australis]